MDRDRLKQVQQTDLTESRVNEDFVLWLKTKAPTYLLIVLLVIAGGLFIQRLRTGKQRKHDEAWAQLMLARGGSPQALEEVAREYDEFLGVWMLAHTYAADEYLSQIIVNRPLSATEENATLTDADREEYLRIMTAQYENILERDDGSIGTAIHGFNAQMGLATVAECRGDLEGAAAAYRAAADRVDGLYEDLVAFATYRAEHVGDLRVGLELPETAATTTTPQDTTPVSVEPALMNLINPPPAAPEAPVAEDDATAEPEGDDAAEAEGQAETDAGDAGGDEAGEGDDTTDDTTGNTSGSGDSQSLRE